MPDAIEESPERIPYVQQPESLVASATSSQKFPPVVNFYLIYQHYSNPQLFPGLPHETYIGGPSSIDRSAIDSKRLGRE